MKYYVLIASFFVFACNQEEGNLKTQLSDLENQLPQAEKEYYTAYRTADSLRESVSGQGAEKIGALLNSTPYKQAESAVTQKQLRVDSLKKAIADTKEKILLNK